MRHLSTYLCACVREGRREGGREGGREGERWRNRTRARVFERAEGTLAAERVSSPVPQFMSAAAATVV